jgi:hypothetical protein
VLSWPAIYAVVSEVDQRGMVWPDDVPPSVVDHLVAATDEEPTTEATPPPSEPAAEDESRKRRRAHLKLVK